MAKNIKVFGPNNKVSNLQSDVPVHRAQIAALLSRGYNWSVEPDIACIHAGEFYGEPCTIWVSQIETLAANTHKKMEDLDVKPFRNGVATKFMIRAGLMSAGRSVYGNMVVLTGKAVYETDDKVTANPMDRTMPIPLVQQAYKDRLEKNTETMNGLRELVEKGDIPELREPNYSPKAIAYMLRFLFLTVGTNDEFHTAWQQMTQKDAMFNNMMSFLHSYQEALFSGQLDDDEDAPDERRDQLLSAAFTVLATFSETGNEEDVEGALDAQFEAEHHALKALGDAVGRYRPHPYTFADDTDDDPSEQVEEQPDAKGKKKTTLH